MPSDPSACSSSLCNRISSRLPAGCSRAASLLLRFATLRQEAPELHVWFDKAACFDKAVQVLLTLQVNVWGKTAADSSYDYRGLLVLGCCFNHGCGTASNVSVAFSGNCSLFVTCEFLSARREICCKARHVRFDRRRVCDGVEAIFQTG